MKRIWNFIIPIEDIEGTIEEFLADKRIDLLAMVEHKKTFLRNS